MPGYASRHILSFSALDIVVINFQYDILKTRICKEASTVKLCIEAIFIQISSGSNFLAVLGCTVECMTFQQDATLGT